MAITVTNLTVTRAYDANAVSLNTLADALGTLVNDVQSGTYNGSQWTITNGTIDRSINALSGSANELADVIYTIITDNPGAFTTWNIEVTNYTTDNALNANSATIKELMDVLGTLRAEQVNPIGPPRFEYMGAFTPGFELAMAE